MSAIDATEFSPAMCRRLTAAMQRGDEVAWREFHERYFEFLLGDARLRGARGEDAYDLVQRSYLRILRHVKRMGKPADLEAWMRCLMRCEVIDLGRAGARRNALMEKYAHWQEARRPEERMPDQTADEILKSLSEDDRSLMMRCYVDGWSHQELADEVDSTPKAIESKLARLRKRLRSCATTNL